MATAFNMLRSNDLIWPYVSTITCAARSRSRSIFCIWNSDATRMPAANHSFYLRNCYLDNTLSRRRDGNCRRHARSAQSQGADLQSRHPRRSHRAGEIGAARLAILRRAGEIRAGRLRPYRRRGQSAGEREIPVLDRRARRAAPMSTNGWRRPRNIPAPGGRTGSPGSRATAPRRCRRARSAAGN